MRRTNCSKLGFINYELSKSISVLVSLSWWDLFVAVKKGENRRENESPTGTGSQCQQGKMPILSFVYYNICGSNFSLLNESETEK